MSRSRSAHPGMLGCLAFAAALAVTACGSGGATPPVIYITPTPGPRPTPSPVVIDTTPTPEPTPTAAETPTPTPTPAPTPAPVVASITTTPVSQTGYTASCGNWTVSFKKPVVSGIPIAATMNAAITLKVNGYINDFKAQLEGGGGAGPCALDGKFAVAVDSFTLISMSLSLDEYLGGADATTIAGSLNLLVSSGATLALRDLFTSAAAGAAVLSTQSRAQLTALLGPDGVDAGFIDPGTTPFLSNFEAAWVFKPTGLEITFQQMQVAPAAEGTPTILISWASLKSVINSSGPAGPYVK